MLNGEWSFLTICLGVTKKRKNVVSSMQEIAGTLIYSTDIDFGSSSSSTASSLRGCYINRLSEI